eukprot:CAMPEP_0117459636 /NCGR_PEP_ID=MMETSP0784-20121206/1584_1 /TAXON_ID=39447 /ORGANISM="" /LENGTH=117 /DNA_ID=CAMNT_0005253263 /DNA_START=311 /DNA_END=661 /DNA_ORIENTATION=+
MALIPAGGSEMMVIVVGIRAIIDASSVDQNVWGFKVMSIPWIVFFSVFCLSAFVTIFAQLLGGWQGYKGFSEMQALEPQDVDAVGGSQGGGWGAGALFGGQGGRQPIEGDRGAPLGR